MHIARERDLCVVYAPRVEGEKENRIFDDLSPMCVCMCVCVENDSRGNVSREILLIRFCG